MLQATLWSILQFYIHHLTQPSNPGEKSREHRTAILIFFFENQIFIVYKYILKNSPQKMLFSHLPIFFNTPDIKDFITP